MNFKDLVNGNFVYIFDRADGTFDEARVMSVSSPRLDSRIGCTGQMVVDITVSGRDGEKTYTMRDSLDTAFVGTLAICTGKTEALREVDTIERQCEQSLSQVERWKKLQDKCRTLRAELDPAERDRREMDAWKQDMDNRMSKLTEMIENMAKLTTTT